MKHVVHMTVAGGAGSAVSKILTGWGYVCRIEPVNALERLTAKGELALSLERFRQLLAVVADCGGMLYAFWMAEEPT